MNPRLLTGSLITSAFFTAGFLSFVSGQTILSTTLFGAACLASNIKTVKAKPVRI